MSELRASRDLLNAFVDDEPCSFDHHGGCQAHGYLSLEPGELCPQVELKALLRLAPCSPNRTRSRPSAGSCSGEGVAGR